MQISKQSKQWKRWYHLSLIVLLGLIGFLGYLYVMMFFKEREHVILEKQITEKEQLLSSYHATTGLNQLLSIDTLITQKTQLPRNEYIKNILEILYKIKTVDQENAHGIFLSDFKVDLEKLSLNGFVSSLSTLYYNSEKSDGFISLLDRFEQLDFLDNIEIKTYQYTKDNEHKGFNFTLYANINSHE